MSERTKGIIMTWLLGIGLMLLAGLALRFPQIRWFISGFVATHLISRYAPGFCYGYVGVSTMIAPMVGMAIAFNLAPDGGMALIFGGILGWVTGLDRLKHNHKKDIQ